MKGCQKTLFYFEQFRKNTAEAHLPRKETGYKFKNEFVRQKVVNSFFYLIKIRGLGYNKFFLYNLILLILFNFSVALLILFYIILINYDTKRLE